MTVADPNRLIASLVRDQVNLDLKTADICFLAGLYLRADKAGLASFEEDLLVDLFEQVCDVVEPAAENPRKRATHAIQRLREQRMLARVDGAGIVRAGEYALTRLAAAVIEYFLTDEALTRESLSLLTGILRAQLADVLATARKAQDDEDWHRHVVAPLRITVGDLVAGIERRQRGLDAQQEEVQAEIASLLSTDWFSAVDRCQALLDATTRTLRELNEILLRDAHHFVALLQDIQALAMSAQRAEPEEAAQRVIEHVDRIAAWGSARQKAWSEYYQYVHRYLRDVVRLDPDRALSQRLRDQIVGWQNKPFHLVVAHAGSICLLRPLEARVERPAVARPRTDREAEPAWVEAENALADIEVLVNLALEEGIDSLAGVTLRVIATLTEDSHYVTVGRVADAVARFARLRSSRERPWRAVDERLEIEDWNVQGQRKAQ
ncbi:condensin subunit F [Xanthomonas hyacinthi]|uniref:Condensin subunit F n=1 Tax=Xanthomonas hyacinthi TaxID=56455 RepID=A0A2S7EUA7_9XANT|nr:condensin subunit F [Xanthomonas hyacinthi]KLD78161.1 condesin subunit F [Xanthomonas hyacinthi DSM 19077]PPU96744.1 condensin subunit F [Xanthomonas hyacinthi]QGY76310.1 condensin subunit F [Xanthomonas hyacinthi]